MIFVRRLVLYAFRVKIVQHTIREELCSFSSFSVHFVHHGLVLFFFYLLFNRSVLRSTVQCFYIDVVVLIVIVVVPFLLRIDYVPLSNDSYLEFIFNLMHHIQKQIKESKLKLRRFAELFV